MPDRPIGVGVIGATGFIGTPYREEIRGARGARLVALCARRRDLLEKAGREDRATLVTCDWRAVVGWRVQLFTDAAALSAERGAWVELEEVEARA